MHRWEAYFAVSCSFLHKTFSIDPSTCVWSFFAVSRQEELILDIVNDPNCKPKQFRHSYLRSTAVLILVTLMVRGTQLIIQLIVLIVFWYKPVNIYIIIICASVSLLLFQLMLIIGLAHALVVFRVVAAPLFSEGDWLFIRDHANTVAVMMGAVLHYITIQVMTRVFPNVLVSTNRLDRTTTKCWLINILCHSAW